MTAALAEEEIGYNIGVFRGWGVYAASYRSETTMEAASARRPAWGISDYDGVFGGGRHQQRWRCLQRARSWRRFSGIGDDNWGGGCLPVGLMDWRRQQWRWGRKRSPRTSMMTSVASAEDIQQRRCQLLNYWPSGFTTTAEASTEGGEPAYLMTKTDASTEEDESVDDSGSVVTTKGQQRELRHNNMGLRNWLQQRRCRRRTRTMKRPPVWRRGIRRWLFLTWILLSEVVKSRTKTKSFHKKWD